MAGALLHGHEEAAFGDAGYQGVHKRPEAAGPSWHVAMRPGKRKLLNQFIEPDFVAERVEKMKASIRKTDQIEAAAHHSHHVTSNRTALRVAQTVLKRNSMSKLENRTNTALLVVDMQDGVIAQAYGRNAVVKNVESLVAKARREQVSVIWVQHSDKQLVRGSDTWQIVPELTPDEAERRIEKLYGDAFEDTDLEAVLSDLGVGRLVVAGAQSDACIRSTIHGAFVRGYDVILVSDAHTTEDHSEWGAPPPDKVIAHTNLYWAHQTAPGRTAGTVETKGVGFGVAP